MILLKSCKLEASFPLNNECKKYFLNLVMQRKIELFLKCYELLSNTGCFKNPLKLLMLVSVYNNSHPIKKKQ